MKFFSRTRWLALMLSSMTVAPGSFQLLASPQASNTAPDVTNRLQVPEDITFLATLTTPIDIARAKGSDAVEAQTSQDIKQGHQVLLKKGSTLLGHVDSVQPPTATDSGYHLVVVFDRVKPKKGEEMQFHLVIQALAPKSDVDTGSVPFATGRGMQGATMDNIPSGHASATQGSVNSLTATSRGVQDMRGLDLSERIADGQHSTVLSTSQKDLQLKKGTQLVMKVVSQ